MLTTAGTTSTPAPAPTSTSGPTTNQAPTTPSTLISALFFGVAFLETTIS